MGRKKKSSVITNREPEQVSEIDVSEMKEGVEYNEPVEAIKPRGRPRKPSGVAAGKAPTNGELAVAQRVFKWMKENGLKFAE
jgi:hypothetical protein